MAEQFMYELWVNPLREQQSGARGKIERGEVNVTVVTTPKLVKGLDLSLTGFFSELEKELDKAEDR